MSEERPNGLTPYQQAVAEYMADAPQELRDYVCERLKEATFRYTYTDEPILFTNFLWRESNEGEFFWHQLSLKKWHNAMATDFWIKCQVEKLNAEQVAEQTKPSKEAREFWEKAFCAIAQSPKELKEPVIELADEAMAEWQKRFEP